VVATGPYQRPVIPALLQDDASLFQVHASRYREPDQLPPGAVLIVGSGAPAPKSPRSSFARAAKCIFRLAATAECRADTRARSHLWLTALGLDQTPVESRGPDKSLPLITGAYGGHTIDFRHFAAQGMTLLGRVEAGREGILDLAPTSPTAWRSGMPPTRFP